MAGAETCPVEPQRRTALLLQLGLYLLVASIPFEYPDRTIPLEIPTLTGTVFLLVSLLYPSRCYDRVPAPALWFGAYLLVYLLLILRGEAEQSSAAMAEFVVILQGVLVLLAAGNVLKDEAIARRAMKVFVAACLARAALPFLGLARTTSVVWTGGERVSALGQNANSAAMILAAGLVTLIGLTYGRSHRGHLRFLAPIAMGTLLGMAVLETGSRGGLASLLGGVLVFALAADSVRTRLRNAAIGGLAIALLIAGSLQIPVMKNRLADSMLTGSLAGREQLYPALWTMFQERPALGWGPVVNTHELALRIGERERPRRASHNIVLELLTSTGLAGAIPFLIGSWLCIRAAWRGRLTSAGVLPLALVATVLISNMSGDWIAAKLIWVVLAYALASEAWRLESAASQSVPLPPLSVAPAVQLALASAASNPPGRGR